jgi:ABC-type lipoprotein release transport system permease subunit
LLVPVLATVPPVLQALRIKILEAITDLGIKASFRQGVLSQLLDAFPLPVGLRQALRSLLSKTGRLALTTFTLSLAAGAFMAVFALINSLNSVTDNIFNTFGNDITIAPSGFAGPEAMQSVQTVEGVADISPASILAVEIIGYTPVGVGAAPASLGAFGVDTSNPAMVNYQLRSGRAWYDDPDKGGVVISNGIADSLGKDTGDSLRVRAGANTQDFEIVGVTQYPFPTIWFPWQALSRMGGLEFGGQAIPNVYSVILSNPDMTAEEVDDLIGRINEQLLAQNVNANYTNWVSTNEYVAQLISTSAALLNIAAALIGAVGAIGLLSTLSMSVFERQKEIGVMRSIGANSLNVAVQFLIEGWLVGLIAWLLGLPISYFLNGVLTETFNFGEGAGISYPPETVLFGLGLMFILTTIASLSPAMAAARKTVSDILRYQ